MNAISYYDHYNQEMNKALQDKLFFVDKVDARNILDYGCANGALIYEMAKYFPNKHYVGYDIDKNMVDIANKNVKSHCHFYDNLARANINVKSHDGNNMILCSSVIHEVYSYGDENSIKAFWDNLYHGHYDYVVIRDMALSDNDVNSETLAKEEDVEAVYKFGDKTQIEQFTNIWGSLTLQKNLLHFLFKYRYLQNWTREVEENYFPVSVQKHLEKISDKYEMVYFEHFLLPFQKETIKKDFGIDVENCTHLKMILKKIK